MEDIITKDEAAPLATAARSKLRYPLRSATKSKEEKTTPPPPEVSKSSATKRGRPASSVSKSMNVLDLSGKEKSSKPPRRLSIPAKPTVSSVSKTTGNITPIAEVRAKRSVNTQGKSDTPASDVTKSGNRKRFSTLSSASYWLSQIKLSESVAKHSISLSFFKLAFEAGCEPIQRMRDELKSYARRHNLAELGELAKEVFESYNISEIVEQSQVSETISQVPEEGTRSSDDDVYSSSSTMGIGKLKPKSLNVDACQASTIAESAKENSQKTSNSAIRTRGSLNKSSANAKSVTETGGRQSQRKPQKASKQESKKEKDKIKKQGKKCASEEAKPLPAEETVEEDKENMGTPQLEDINSAEVM